MDRLRALQYFVASAECGSFAGAARRLEVSVPAVHKLVNALERHLGAKLFERSARGLSTTASGQAYLESCRPLLEELAALDESLRRSAQRPSGTLVVAAHPQLAHHLLLPWLPQFHARCPEVQVELRVIHRLGDADAEAADVFVLHGWPEAPDLVHHRLGLARSLVAAAPQYWAARGIPQHPRELAGHECLLLRNPAGILLDLWEFERGGERESVKVAGWLVSNDREAMLDAVLAGHGTARLNRLTSLRHLQGGQLVPVLADWEVQGGPPLNLLFRPGHRRTPRVRLFVDFLIALLDETLDDGASGVPRHAAELPHWHRRGYGRASATLRWGG